MYLVIRKEPTAAAARMAQNNAMVESQRPAQRAAGRMALSVQQIRFAAAVRVSPVLVASMYIIIHAKMIV
jgi:hypothetical protein